MQRFELHFLRLGSRASAGWALRKTARRLVTVLIAISAMPAYAQLEEVIVTAQKRTESAQDVPFSITALDNETIRELGATDMTRLVGQLSNVGAYGPGMFLASFNIRGIGLNQFQGNFSTPVAVHIDEVYMGKPYLAPALYDIDRVEVLKGPQGTLFGRNTTGGSVNYYTRQPTDDLQIGVDLSVDEWSRYTGEAFVSGPVAGAVTGRLSVFGNFGDGAPVENLYNGRDAGIPHRYFGRGQLQWRGADTAVNLTFEGGRDRGETVPYKTPGIYNYDPQGTPTFCPQLLQGLVSNNPSLCAKFGGLTGNPAVEYEPNDLYKIYQNRIGHKQNSYYAARLRVTQETSLGTVTSLTAFQHVTRLESENSDGSAISSLVTTYESPVDQFSQELRLAGTALSDRWTYVGGLFYSHEHLSEFDGSNTSLDPLLGGLPGLGGDFIQTLDSSAVFANSEFAVADKLSLVGGARYTRDKTAVDGNTYLAAFASNLDFAPVAAIVVPVDSIDTSRTDTNFSYKIGLNYRPIDAVLAYVSYSTGYRNGGYSVPFGGAINSFEPEKIRATEAGIKSELFDRKLRINAAVFHYDYLDPQLKVNDPTHDLVAITTNVDKQLTSGAELDVQWAPTAQWTVQGGLGYLDAELRADATHYEQTYAGAIPLNGNVPPNAPKWTANGLVRHERPLTSQLNLVLSADARWVDDHYLQPSNQVFDVAEAYTLVNARAALASSSGNWEVALWGNNLGDTDYVTYINNVSFLKIDIWGERRTFGLSFSYRNR